VRGKKPILLCLAFILLITSNTSLTDIFLKRVQAQSTLQNCEVSGSLLTQSGNEKTLFDLINSYREQNGLGMLTWSSSLKRASAWLTNDMSTNGYFSHTDSLGREPGVRLTQCGYSWSAYGENIYPNSANPQSAFDAWKNSPSHNQAMLNSSYKEAGISNQGSYWTLDLGSSSNSPAPTSTLSPALSPTLSPTLTPTPSPTPSIILNPTDTKVRISIRLAGIGKGGNEKPKNLTRLVSVDIFNLENKKVLTGSGFLKYNNKDGFVGDIRLGQIANDVYYVKVTAVNTLTGLVVPEFQTINSEQPNALPQVVLIQGDLNSDNVINIKDFNIALFCFQSRICPKDVGIDFNDDGLANVVDYNIFLSSFKRTVGD
jgi:uncharacterized protein YkwD